MVWVGVSGAVALVAVAIAFVALVYLHVVAADVSPVERQLGQYGITPFAAGYRGATIALGISALAIAVGVSLGLPHQSTGLWVLCLVVFGVARIAISWFAADAPDADRTMSGRNHSVIVVITFVSITVGAYLAAVPLSENSSWSGLAPTTTGLAVAMSVFSVLLLIALGSAAVRRVAGLIERLLYLTIIVWLIIFGVACIMHA